ncbi:hypothetical protein SAMN05428975_3127 [Mucilaginibacter sp. OK268]|uniref:Pycsar system effector family protein n=1 Tax=Mucilaginibacter sp. OK268 TaxID=1881048 RepID=UPI0008857725|nr:Pycsar system effector family protein [Mucilaginibacter sp. OK268]SDP86407.1 hypothetical protein SAMN05428975_3127 [Mucilaginibacter sp. OK268]
MSTTQHNQRYWEILQTNIEWLRFSETKATLVLTVYGVLFTLIYTNSTAVFTSVSASGWLLFMVFVYVGFALTSIGFAFLCINPILQNKNPNSIIYFGHISKKFKNKREYMDFAKTILDDEEKYADQITEQIYVISKVAWNKYVKVTWALRFFIGGLAWLLLILIVYLIQTLHK